MNPNPVQGNSVCTTKMQVWVVYTVIHTTFNGRRRGREYNEYNEDNDDGDGDDEDDNTLVCWCETPPLD